MEKKFCRECGIELNQNNWYACYADKSIYYCKLCEKAKRYQYRRMLKCEIVKYYGNHACACCGEYRLEFLSIDHVYGGGRQHRKEIGLTKDGNGGGGARFYRWLKNNNFPDGFRVLCHNCNQSIGMYGYCPHNKEIKGTQYKPLASFAGMSEMY